MSEEMIQLSHIFSFDDRLSAKQIKSYFSRLLVKEKGIYDVKSKKRVQMKKK